MRWHVSGAGPELFGPRQCPVFLLHNPLTLSREFGGSVPLLPPGLPLEGRATLGFQFPVRLCLDPAFLVS